MKSPESQAPLLRPSQIGSDSGRPDPRGGLGSGPSTSRRHCGVRRGPDPGRHDGEARTR